MDRVILGTDGQTICRPTTWKDVLKFFILNYGLHVLTIVSAPGSKTVPTMIRSLGALLIPFSGTFTALDVIHRFARGQSGDLPTAHRAGALCMFLPTRLLSNSNNSAEHVHRQLTEVHGQHPVLPQLTFWQSFQTSVVGMVRKQQLEFAAALDLRNPGPLGGILSPSMLESYRAAEPFARAIVADDQILSPMLRRFMTAIVMALYGDPRTEPEAASPDGNQPGLRQFDQILDPDVESTPVAEYSLIIVPKSFTVAPLSDTGFTPLTLSCNYSIPKAIVAILQVVYGTTELYQSSVRQLPKFGYAAYSLTVIPYLIMSLVNLVAAACEPQYPTMFLVRYGGSSTIDQAASQDGDAPPAVSDLPEELVRGAVGEAYGSLHADLSGNQPFDEDNHETLGRWTIIRIGGWVLIGVSYLIIYLLTHFNGRESTGVQRGFTMAWLVIGQLYGWLFYVVRGSDRMVSEGLLLGLALGVGAGAVGGFVVVGQMMMGDETCTVI